MRRLLLAAPRRSRDRPVAGNRSSRPFVGTYTSASFSAVNGGTGGVKITDPPVIEQQPGNAAATTASDTVPEVRVPDSGKVTLASSTDTLWLDEPSTTPRNSGWFVSTKAKRGTGTALTVRVFGLGRSGFAYSETARARTPFHPFKCVLARIAAHVEKAEGRRVPGDLSVDPERYPARGEEDETKTETHGIHEGFLEGIHKKDFSLSPARSRPGAKP
jgi:hypothetical protein